MNLKKSEQAIQSPIITKWHRAPFVKNEFELIEITPIMEDKYFTRAVENI